MSTYFDNGLQYAQQEVADSQVYIDQIQYQSSDYGSLHPLQVEHNYDGHQSTFQSSGYVLVPVPTNVIMIEQPMLMQGQNECLQNGIMMSEYHNQIENFSNYQSGINQPIFYQPEATIYAHPVYAHEYYQLEVAQSSPALLVPHEMPVYTMEDSGSFSEQTELIGYHFQQQGAEIEEQLINQEVSRTYEPIKAVYAEPVAENLDHPSTTQSELSGNMKSQPSTPPTNSQPLPSSLSPIPSSEPISTPKQSTSSENSKKDEDEKENLQKAKNFKTRMCIYKDRCNLGSRCTYAHSSAELRSNETKKVSNQLKKTKLCLNFASGGSGKCEYGENCQFIHPEDGLLYERVYRETLEFLKEKADHKNDIQFLHAKKSQPGCTDVFQIEEEINEKIRGWNQKHPKAQDYYDLHWMTTRGAEDYVEEILEKMKEDNKKTSWIETGRGRHSWNGVAAIKTTLLQKYTGRKDVSLVPDSKNAGLLILTIL